MRDHPGEEEDGFLSEESDIELDLEGLKKSNLNDAEEEEWDTDLEDEGSFEAFHSALKKFNHLGGENLWNGTIHVYLSLRIFCQKSTVTGIDHPKGGTYSSRNCTCKIFGTKITKILICP